jgi:hypothetical protein
MERLVEWTALPLRFVPEEPIHVLPSIVVGTDGLNLRSVIVVTSSYLGEIRWVPEGNSDFDLVLRARISNYRVKTWTHEIKEGETVKATFEVAAVSLLHSLSGSLTGQGPGPFSTQIYYAGDAPGRSEWLNEVSKALPVSLLISSR